MKYLLFSIFVIILFIPINSFSVPVGWRYPDKTDLIGTWAKHRAKLPQPYHIEADFNEDGTMDHIWLMIKLNQKGWGLFAFMSSISGELLTIKIEEGPEGKPQDRGILYIKPGTMQSTACGLGIPKCDPGDAYRLQTETPTIQLFHYEGGSLFYSWSSEKLRFIGDTIED